MENTTSAEGGEQSQDDRRLIQSPELQRAINAAWPVDASIRQRVVNAALSLLDSPDHRARSAACRIILGADSLNARRERARLEANTADTSSTRAAYAQLLSTPEGRQLVLRQAELLDSAACSENLSEVRAEPTREREREKEGWGSPGPPIGVLLLIQDTDVHSLLIATLGAEPDGLPQAESQATSYTTNPPDATPPPAPLRRPSRLERRGRRL